MVKNVSDDSALKGEQTAMNAITIDCVIFGFDKGSLEVLLVQHGEGISKGKWGLPGGWIYKKESTDDAAHRLLNELTGLDNIYLEQLKAFGDPDRFPLRRVITIGYYALVKREDYNIKAGFTAADAKWYKINNIPDLIYDHNEILAYSLKHLQNRVRQAPIGFNLLPEKFTLLQLMHLYEEVLGVEMDKSNFRRKILHMKLLVALDEKQQDVSHRAAKLYQFDPAIYKKLTEKGFNFEF
ncbi:ADP-ribose pyrophosphatase YjhB (NUDIX family) [Flavobacterium araucananum]|jgi:8-oxo-dGTP diphosphatase|uniref:NUDIX hydrolase n=1 Tax=Flavobacterium araucananum TaxID=946678 RepID=A0A227PFE7_9FLAO|nr:NUDIX domain-containing protein [Flavobacterium araucananum]OXG08094.1 NUDIX hydrolase [Flavobacterium araucananum]PWK02220.1 ADP-ribose pyrophosphatase YjhB (NUDIX family) [Flavobacterium araucananum]